MKNFYPDQGFAEAIKHRDNHECSAYPYESYQKLADLVSEYSPQHILEIGSGFGFTSLIMAQASPSAKVETIEKDPAHVKAARKNIEKYEAQDQVLVIEAVAEEYLPMLQKNYDLIFFDGYQIHYEFLPQYKRLLNSNGVLVLGNNQLSSKTSNKFFDELVHSGDWEIVEQFSDTTVAKKK